MLAKAANPDNRRVRLLRQLSKLALLTAIYVAAGNAGLALASVHASVTPVWPPTGIAIAGLLFLGVRAWPMIFVGAFVVNQITSGGWAASLVIAAGNTCEAVLAALLVQRFAHGLDAFSRVGDVFRFVLLAGVCSTTVSATIGVVSLSVFQGMAWRDVLTVWDTWWLGDMTGAIVVAPMLILWLTAPRPRWTRLQWLEIAVIGLASVALAWLIFIRFTFPLAFLCLPICIWTAFRFGSREASAVMGLMSLIAVWGTVHARGPFAGESTNTALLSVQAFTAVTMLVGLVIGAAITERKRLEAGLERHVADRTAELQASESRLAEAQEVARIGSWEWDLATQELWWSTELYRMWQVDPSAYRPTYERFLERIHQEDRAHVESRVLHALETREPFEFDFRLIRCDGQERSVFGKGRVIDGPGGGRMVGIGQDITERKQLELQFQQAQKLEAVGLLAGGIAHDFNNLLTAIGGCTEIVLWNLADGDPDRLELMEVRKAVDRAAALTRRLLAFGRQQTLQPQVLDLNALVLGTETLLRRTIGEHIELSLDLDPHLEAIRIDPCQFEQVLLNLALNARDAMPSGGQLEFVTRTADVDENWARRHPPMTSGRYVHLTVTDTGIGMSAETCARIFEPFFTTKPSGHGSGFGLATSYGILKQSGGFIWVTSEEGRGASFDIYLPVVREPLSSLTLPRPFAQSTNGSETILLVEDDMAVRRLAETVLRKHGYAVLSARDGEEALAIAQRCRQTIDLLITDVVMPGVSGRDLAARLQADHAMLRVLYTSGYMRDAMVTLGVQPSAPFLPKPFLPADLLSKTREVLLASAQ
jgi:signal transduction histidine kinase/integral membrane sensor domain MASE1/CheY-like chemotaxis protein